MPCTYGEHQRINIYRCSPVVGNIVRRACDVVPTAPVTDDGHLIYCQVLI